MSETALKFGPEWIRALGSGSSSAPSTASMPIPRYSLAEFRYGREEMLALIPTKDIKLPNCLKQFPYLIRDNFQIPLALTPVTDEEQRLLSSRSVNSDLAFRASGKTGPGYSMHRTGRGGSVDRGRGRGRGGYYQRNLMHDDVDEGLGFSRPKTVERSLSASEKDHRWDDRDRRYDRPYSGRGGYDDTGVKHDMRGPNEYWRKVDKDDEGDWRSSGFRSADKPGGRGTWRSNSDRDRRDMAERVPPSRSSSGNIRGASGPQSKPSNHSSAWKEENPGRLPEWSVEETAEPDAVGTFDSSGAFLETKVSNNTSLDEIYASDDADEGISKQDSPEAKRDSSKKSSKKSNSSPSIKQTSDQKSTKSPNGSRSVEEIPVKNKLESSKSNTSNSKTIVEKSTENVIKQSTNVEKLTPVQTKTDFVSVTQPNVPISVSEPLKMESVILNSNVRNSEKHVMSAAGAVSEEDAFAYHQKATENMVAQWTEEIEDQRVPPQKDLIHSTHHEKDIKWFYQDPQGDIQGPFASQEMLEWYSAGYFTDFLMVRRSCDEKFSKLGDLVEAWGCIPFLPNSNPPPIRLTPNIGGPINQTVVPNPVTTSNQLPKQDEQILALQQQQQFMQQQILQQQLLIKQAQLQQIIAQLSKQESFTSLTNQQQEQIITQQYLAQQILSPSMKPVPDKPNLMNSVNPLSLPLLGMPLPGMMKPVWPGGSGTDTWSLPPGPPGGSIWDLELSKPGSNESEKLKMLEEQEKKRKAEELRLQQEREAEEKRLEELRRQREEEARLIQELQKQEEERKRLEELQRQREEEQRRLEELKRLEEQKRREEEEERKRQEELRKKEEQMRLEELRRQEELRKLEEKRRQEEEKKKQEEMKRIEEQLRQEELRKQQELRKLEEKRKKEEQQKKLQMEKEREKQVEIERQKDALRQKELEREEKLRKERERREKEEEDMKRLAELKIKSQGPVWGIQKSQTNVQLSLADIQRLQEEKEREEREEKARQQLLQQQAAKQVQQNKNGLSWAKRANDSEPAVKSLAEIQQEEAERLSKLNRVQKPPAPAPTVNSNAGVWGNSSHLNKITASPPTWNLNSVSSANNIGTGGFWDDALNSTQLYHRRQPSKPNSNDSAFPALAIPVQPANVSSNKGKNVRAKKDEDAVTRLFVSHHKPTDEFTKWCTDAISSMPSSVDVPTFVAFLKDIESPYEVYDYVKSYFGEGKEPREFAKLFLEKRSKFRNQAKQAPAEDNTLWGPAPAITPAVNKNPTPTTIENDGNAFVKVKSKKKKGRMQKLDSSMLGFTVQSNPDRLNVGEIDHIENI